MGSKKHKKHHKSEKRDVSFDDRSEKPLKLVLKVTGASSSIQQPLVQMPIPVSTPVSSSSEHKSSHGSEHKSTCDKEKSGHSHEKHKKSKKKKKKKSSDKDKDRHEKKRKHHHHHHHHREHSRERKEKRKREQQELSRSVLESHEDVVPKPSLLEAQVAIPIEKSLRGPRSCTLKKKTVKSPLQILLYYMLKRLQMKDPQEFFAWPVTDAIAPGYSTIIKNPTDFSTIKKKVDDREYKMVLEFKSDIKLMCDNAMTYNRSDTVYYKSARRMWHAAQKQLSKEQLISMKRNLPYLSELTEQELGFDISEESVESLPGTEIVTELNIKEPEAKKTKVTPSWSNLEPDNDDSDELSPEDILAEAQKAARAAAEKLTLKRPNSKFGFLRQHENGTTTLSILHSKSGDQEMKVNLESLTGKLSQGTGAIIGFKEDSKNIIKPVTYTNYCAYSSYAPHYDSMFSNLSKDESDLIMSTYGDDIGIQYADSILTFSKDSDYVITMVDNMLDVLTGGEHSKTIKALEEKRKAKEQPATKSSETTTKEQESTLQAVAEQVESESIQALNDIDLEMSLIDTTSESDSKGKRKFEKVSSKSDLNQRHKILLTQRKAIQQKLDNATQLLQDLRKVQNERLSTAPPPHLSLVQGPSLAETELADKLTKKIADIALQLPPESVSSVDGLRKAMGITAQPKSVSRHPSGTFGKSSSLSQVTEPSYSITSTRLPSPFQPTSPNPSAAEKQLNSTDMDLQHFLETGPVLRVCDSPTGS